VTVLRLALGLGWPLSVEVGAGVANGVLDGATLLPHVAGEPTPGDASEAGATVISTPTKHKVTAQSAATALPMILLVTSASLTANLE